MDILPVESTLRPYSYPDFIVKHSRRRTAAKAKRRIAVEFVE